MNQITRFGFKWMEIRGWDCKDDCDPTSEFNSFTAQRSGVGEIQVVVYLSLHRFDDAASACVFGNGTHKIKSAVPLKKFPSILIDFSIDLNHAIVAQIVEGDPRITTSSIDSAVVDIPLDQKSIVLVPKSDIFQALDIDGLFDLKYSSDANQI